MEFVIFSVVLGTQSIQKKKSDRIKTGVSQILG